LSCRSRLAQGDRRLTILHGTLAPDGCVIKLAGHEAAISQGPGPRLRERERLLRAVRDQKIDKGDVIVIR